MESQNENRRSVFIKCHVHKGGVYCIFYNEFSGNWFVQLEDGNRPNNPIPFFKKPYRINGAFNNPKQCVSAIERFAAS